MLLIAEYLLPGGNRCTMVVAPLGGIHKLRTLTHKDEPRRE